MTVQRPQTIQIFLPDGSPTSLKIAEITNRVVKAVFVPRNKLELAGQREEVKNVGLYFLFGVSDGSTKPSVYIGEAEECYQRLKQHHRSKEFWSHAIIIISKINAFTKAHVKYLEHIAIRFAQEVGRYRTENTNTPASPFITESMEADLLDNFETIKILLSTLGYPLFEQIKKAAANPKEILFLSGRNVKAEGDLIDDGFVVFKGSLANVKTTPSCKEYLINMRGRLLRDGILIQQSKHFRFAEDYIFNSPSTAAGVVLGRSANGWKRWKDKDGKTLDELKRR